MHLLTGRLHLRGRDVALPELTVHVYAVGVREVPDSLFEPARWDVLMRANWKELDARRMGSVLSRPDGTFRFEYDPSELGERQAPNLWLAVTGPDLAGERHCERVVEAGCDIRGQAAPKESVTVYLDADRLRLMGLLGGAPRVVRGVVVSDMLDRVAKTAAKTETRDLGGRSFSAFFNARQGEAKKETAEAGHRRPRQAEVGLTISMRRTDAADAKLTIGTDESGRPTISSGRPEVARPLTFGGIKRLAAKERGPRDAAAHIQIEPERGRFKLFLARMPENLTLDEGPHLALWTPPATPKRGTR